MGQPRESHPNHFISHNLLVVHTPLGASSPRKEWATRKTNEWCIRHGKIDNSEIDVRRKSIKSEFVRVHRDNSLCAYCGKDEPKSSKTPSILRHRGSYNVPGLISDSLSLSIYRFSFSTSVTFSQVRLSKTENETSDKRYDSSEENRGHNSLLPVTLH